MTLVERLSYNKVSIEMVAEVAGVSKQTIYKWWASKPRLVMEAYSHRADTVIEMPKTGDIDNDMRTHMRDLCRVYAKGTKVQFLLGVLNDAMMNDALMTEFRKTFLDVRRQHGRELLQLGIERKQIPAIADFELALDLMYGPLFYRMVMRTGELDEKFADENATSVLQKLRATR